MKTFILILCASMLSLASCKKDRVCTCTDQDGNQTKYDIRNQTLNEAKSQCNSYEYDRTILGIHTYNDCAL
jgi:hypothetical protein